jgi:hypothetical protein
MRPESMDDELKEEEKWGCPLAADWQGQPIELMAKRPMAGACAN